MEQYINKAALMAEIEKRKSEIRSRISELGNFESEKSGLFDDMSLYDDIISFIDTLEVKEVDLKKESDKESEDGRIKNEIIAFVEQSIHRGGGTPIPQEQENRWIEWLEKQA